MDPSLYEVTQNETGYEMPILYIYIPIIILIIGTLGNLCSFFIFVKLGNLQQLRNCIPYFKKSKEKNTHRKGLTVYFYLCLLALCDMGVIYFGLLINLVSKLTNHNLKTKAAFFCKTLTFLSFFFSHCSSFVLVILTGTRFLAVFRLNLATTLLLPKNVKIVTCGLLVFSAIFNLHFLWNMKIESFKLDDTQVLSSLLTTFKNNHPELKSLDEANLVELLKQQNSDIFNRENCILDHNRMSDWWPFLDKMAYSFLPFILLVIFNIGIVRSITKYEKKNTILYMSKIKLSAHPGYDTFNAINTNCTNEFSNNSNGNNLKNTHLLKTTQIQEQIELYKKFHLIGRKFSLILASISVLFLVLTFPAVFLFLVMKPLRSYLETFPIEKANNYYEKLVIAQTFSLLLMYLNHCSNFFLYFATSSRFRQQFKCTFLNYSFSFQRRSAKPATLYD